AAYAAAGTGRGAAPQSADAGGAPGIGRKPGDLASGGEGLTVDGRGSGGAAWRAGLDRAAQLGADGIGAPRGRPQGSGSRTGPGAHLRPAVTGRRAEEPRPE